MNGRAVRVSPLSLESHEPGPQPRASTLHRGGPRTTCYAYTHTHTRAWGTRESSRARATGPAVELSRSGLRGVAVLAPDYDLPTVLFLTFFFSFSSLSFDANSEKWRTFVPRRKERRGGGIVFLALIFRRDVI